MAGTGGPQSAALTLDIEGVQKTIQATGNGPVDAIFNAIRALVPHEAMLGTLSGPCRHSGHRRASGGHGKMAEGGRSVTARGADPDTLVASRAPISRR